jgi:hypothetical protein
MKIYDVSDPLTVTDYVNNEPIYMIYQYYVPSSDKRHREYKFCLKQNVNNSNIEKVYLLNEKKYTKEELGIENEKIEQVNVERRLSYSDIFNFVEERNLNGYIVFMNADIFVDDTINIIKKSNIHEKKTMIALLRYDLAMNGSYKIFGPRPDSQDTWIFHSKFNPIKKERKIFNFNFGKPGCDNKFTYLTSTIGFDVINCPNQIRTIHVHMSQERNYTKGDVIQSPYVYIFPHNVTQYMKPFDQYIAKSKELIKYTFRDNDKLRNFIENSKKNYIIPRIAGIENNYALIGYKLNINPNDKDAFNYVIKTKHVMKNNAGIQFNHINDVILYSNLYLDTFKNSEMYSVWEPLGDVYRDIKPSHDFITLTYKTQEKVWAFTFDIFHYIYYNPWTIALKGKKILIISAFIESIKTKIPIREKIYGIDLFPECEFVFLKPPQTNGTNPSRVFSEELSEFTKKIEEIKDTFDVALVSCGGYGNLVCNEIYKMGKSSIYVGGVLQMYFGVYGQRWLRERKDMMHLYMNEYWSRPTESEKPENYKNIEGQCYW